MARSDLRTLFAHNVSTFRHQPLAEISGSLGDLGTFLPIVIALSQSHQISLTTTLVFTGIYNILTGLLFGIPLPVQPMKAIAAVALLKSFTAGQTAAAGIFVSSCIFIFSITGILNWLTWAVPIPVVKGIQVGAGLSLIITAGTNILSKLSWTSPSWSDNYIWLGLAFLFLLLTNQIPRTPYALLILVIGILFSIIRITTSPNLHLPTLHWWHPYTQTPNASEWRTGILSAGIGQLPLTTLNSIVAVTHLSADLLPSIPTPSVTAIGLSVSFMNLFGCWFGAMPVCHGSGGLAAQYRFGARSGASVILLGLLKLVLGLVFGESLRELLDLFPMSFLGVMIIAAGLELARVGESLNTPGARDLRKHEGREEGVVVLDEETRKRRWMVMLVTAGLLVAFKNDAVGFLGGLCWHWSYEMPRYIEKLRRGRVQGDEGTTGEEEGGEDARLLP